MNNPTTLTQAVPARPEAAASAELRSGGHAAAAGMIGRGLAACGEMSLGVVRGLGAGVVFGGRALVEAPGSRHLGRRVVAAMAEQGPRCLPVILIVGGFTGLVLGLQGYTSLARFGAAGWLGSLVGLTLTRELGPVLAALMLVGQAGSALAAELGMQRQTEQIDALETMGASAPAILVAPRLLAATVVFPLQTALFVTAGLAGGYVSASVILALEPGLYWGAVERAVGRGDVAVALTKAACFGVLTMGISAFHGFHAHRRAELAGARAVGAATTRAVVQGSVAVLAANYVITSFVI